MSYERDYAKDISDCEWPKPKLPSDLCCNGCGTHCNLSIGLNVRNGDFMPESGKQNFYVEPVIYAGGVKLYSCGLAAGKSAETLTAETLIEICNTDLLYQDALAWCRATCKHSKVK